ncbi:unnamed protein product [Sympodiomycopsis kandeliae]
MGSRRDSFKPTNQLDLGVQQPAQHGATPVSQIQGKATASDRIVHKLFLKGHAETFGANYRLYLWIKLPSDTNQSSSIWPLIPDVDVKLISWCIDPLNEHGQHVPLQESAARAAAFLGAPVGIDGHTSPSVSSVSSASSSSSSRLRITTANYHISLGVPTSLAQRTTTPPQHSHTRQYLVTLNLQVPMRVSPRRHPYTLHLPVPHCLRSRMHFTFAPAVKDAQKEISVQVEPPVGRRQRKSRRQSEGAPGRSSSPLMSPNEDDDGKSIATQSEYEEGQSESGMDVRGWFRSTDKVSLRWASIDAGKLQADDELPALHCVEALSSLRIKYCEEAQWNSQKLYHHQEDDLLDPVRRIQLDLSMRIQLLQPYCPGLGHLTYFPLVLDSFGQQADCLNISLDPCDGLRYWHLLTMKEGDRGPTPVADVTKRKTHPRSPQESQSQTISRSTSPSLDESNTSVETGSESEDILCTRPPRGLNIDASMDESALFESLPAARHNNTVSQMNGPRGAINPPDSASIAPPSARHQIILFVDPAVSNPTAEEFTLTLHCRLSVVVRANEDDQDGVPVRWPQAVMPVWRLPTAELHRTSLQVEPAPPPASTARLVPSAKTSGPNGAEQSAKEDIRSIKVEKQRVLPHLSPFRWHSAASESLDTFCFRLLMASEAHTETSSLGDDMPGDVTVQDTLQPGGVAMSKSSSAPAARGGMVKPGTPQSAVHRPLPVYDAITLQVNDDDTSKFSVIPTVKLVAWFRHHQRGTEEREIPERDPHQSDKAGRSPRLIGELTVQWPFINMDETPKPTKIVSAPNDQQPVRQPEELDIWLPRASGERDPVVRSCLVDGRPVKYTTSDAGNSVCLHIRRATTGRSGGAKEEIDDFDDFELFSQSKAGHAGKQDAYDLYSASLKMLYEYPSLEWPQFSSTDTVKGGSSSAAPRVSSWRSSSTSKATRDAENALPLQIPIPMFSQETLSLAITLHIQDSSSFFPEINIGGFDVGFARFEEYSCGKGARGCTVSMRAFSVPSLTPLNIPMHSSQKARKSDTKALRHRLPSFSTLLCILVVAIALFLGRRSEYYAGSHLRASLSSLESRVQQLAMAADVDFSDGTWHPLRQEVPRKRVTGGDESDVSVVNGDELISGTHNDDPELRGNILNEVDSSTRTRAPEVEVEDTPTHSERASKTTALAIVPSPLPTIVTTVLVWPFKIVRGLIDRIYHTTFGGSGT